MALFSVECKDFEEWAGVYSRRDAQGELPLLIRLLVYATNPEADIIEFPVRDSVGQHGFDGITLTTRATQYVPAGLTIWEMGVGSDYKDKADRDYKTRTDTALGPYGGAASSCTFVFVTPRRWVRSDGKARQKVTKEIWQKRKADEGKWQNVLLYDVEALEHWISFAPAVGHWFLGLCGRPRRVFALDRWFTNNWCQAQYPEARPEEVLDMLGSTQERQLADWIRTWLDPTELAAVTATIEKGKPTQPVQRDLRLLSLRLSIPTRNQEDQREQILACVAAVLLNGQWFSEAERMRWLARMVVVERIEEWRLLKLSQAPLIMICIFGTHGEVHHTYRGTPHHVLLPLSESDHQKWPSKEVYCLDIPARAAI